MVPPKSWKGYIKRYRRFETNISSPRLAFTEGMKCEQVKSHFMIYTSSHVKCGEDGAFQKNAHYL